MITIDFALSHSSIRIVSRKLVTSKSQNYVKAHFDLLSDDWTAPITAIFRADNNAYSVLLDSENSCIIPWEVLTTAGTVNVSAFCGDRHTANIAQFDVVQSGYTDGQTPSEPTPTVYEQIINSLANKQDTLIAGDGIKIDDNVISATGGSGSGSDGKSAYEIAVEHGFEGSEEAWLKSLKGDKGEKGEQGEKGQDGVDGKTPEKGVDYFTDEDIANLKITENWELIDEITTSEDVSSIIMYNNPQKPLKKFRAIINGRGINATNSTAGTACHIKSLLTNKQTYYVYNCIQLQPTSKTGDNYHNTIIFTNGYVLYANALGSFGNPANFTTSTNFIAFGDITQIIINVASSVNLISSGCKIKVYGVYA